METNYLGITDNKRPGNEGGTGMANDLTSGLDRRIMNHPKPLKIGISAGSYFGVKSSSLFFLILFCVLACVFPEPAVSECVEGTCGNGYGVYVWEDGQKYFGTWKDGKMDGDAPSYCPTKTNMWENGKKMNAMAPASSGMKTRAFMWADGEMTNGRAPENICCPEGAVILENG